MATDRKVESLERIRRRAVVFWDESRFIPHALSGGDGAPFLA